MSATDWLANLKIDLTYECEGCGGKIEPDRIWTLRYAESEMGHCLPWYCETCEETLAETSAPEHVEE